MLNPSKEMNLLIQSCHGLYQKPSLEPIDWAGVNIDKFLSLASKNNLLLYVARALENSPNLPEELKKRLSLVVQKGEIELIAIQNALGDIHNLMPNSVIVKTFRGKEFVRVPNDIDVVSYNFSKDWLRLLECGYEMSEYLEDEPAAGFRKKGSHKIHLHGAVGWANEQFFDPHLLYQNVRTVLFNEKEVRIPNEEVDVLIHIAHINFEPLVIVYSELLYLFELLPKIDFEKVFEQTEKYRWTGAFKRTVNLMNNFHLRLFGKSLNLPVPFKDLRVASLEFPFCIPRHYLIQNCLEKPLIVYPLKKALKVMDILWSGDTYSKYIEPSDVEKANAGAKA